EVGDRVIAVIARDQGIVWKLPAAGSWFSFTAAGNWCCWAPPFTLRNIPSARGQILFPVRSGRRAGTWLSSASFLCAAWRRILPAGCLRRQRWFYWPWLGWIVVPRRQRPRCLSPVLRW